MIKSYKILSPKNSSFFKLYIKANFKKFWQSIANLCIQNIENIGIKNPDDKIYLLHQLFQSWDSRTETIESFCCLFFISCMHNEKNFYIDRWKTLTNYLLQDNLTNENRDKIVNFYNTIFDATKIKSAIKDEFWSSIFYEIIKNHKKIDEDWIIKFNEMINPSLYYCIKHMDNASPFFNSNRIAFLIVQQKINSMLIWSNDKTECAVNFEEYLRNFLIDKDHCHRDTIGFAHSIVTLCTSQSYDNDDDGIKKEQEKLLHDLYQLFLFFSNIEKNNAIVYLVQKHADTNMKLLKKLIQSNQSLLNIFEQIEQEFNIENFLMPYNKIIKTEKLLASYCKNERVNLILQLHLGLIFEKNRDAIKESFNVIKNFSKKVKNQEKYDDFQRFNTLASLFVGDMIKTIKENNEKRLECLQIFSENFKHVPNVFQKDISPDNPNSIAMACLGFENEEPEEYQETYSNKNNVTNMDKLYTVISGIQNNTSLYSNCPIKQLEKQTIFQDNSYACFIAIAHFPELDFNKQNTQSGFFGF